MAAAEATGEIELKVSPNEKLEVIPAKKSLLTQQAMETSSLPEMPGCRSLVVQSSPESTLVKNDFFRTSYPSLNMVISHVDSVISKISPVAFEPPAYLDESLKNPDVEEKKTAEVQEGAPNTSIGLKSFFASFRDTLVRFQLSSSILPETYTFITLMTTLCTLGCKAVHTIFLIVTALFPMVEMIFHISRFLVDQCLDILTTPTRQNKMRKSFVFLVQVAIIFCLVVFIFGSVLLPLCKLAILILYKVLAFFTK